MSYRKATELNVGVVDGAASPTAGAIVTLRLMH